MSINTEPCRGIDSESLAQRRERERLHRLLIISNLADDFDCINYVKLTDNNLTDIPDRYRVSENIRREVPGIDTVARFTDMLNLLAEYYVWSGEKDKFIASTRRNVIVEQLNANSVYKINFRSPKYDDYTYRQMKFVADFDGDTLIGFVVGISEVDDEIGRALADSRVNEILNVLGSEYNAIYYCNELSHDYTILFQQGFVKEQLDQMRRLCPKYEHAFRFFIDKLVHPDDREMMRGELSKVTEKLGNARSFRLEFRRLYGEEYLYTEMYIVKMGAVEEPLREFVAGFSENDSTYRMSMDRQKQLEYIVSERTQELQDRNSALNRINEDIIELLGDITEARDSESGEHIRRVKGFTHILAKRFMQDYPESGLTEDDVELITSASALHDIGKIKIPDAILLKPGRLTNDEFEIMKTHSEKGCEILRNAPKDWSSSYLKISMEICRGHHERYDGRGYPDGLKGDEIPLSAQIVAVADCFDALISKRVYKGAVSLEEAFNMIKNGECGAFSEKIIASFNACRQEMFEHARSADRIISRMPAGVNTYSLSGVKILFVDDNIINREIGVELLSGEGAEVTQAGSGEEALDIFVRSEVGYFDAILMDVMMPGMSGPEATQKLRELNRADAKQNAVIALTSLASNKDMRRCLSAGMDSFITKPVSISSLNKVLYTCLPSRRQALDEAVKQEENDAEERVKALIRRESHISGIDARYVFSCYVKGSTDAVLAVKGESGFEKALAAVPTRLPSNRRLDKMLADIIPGRAFRNFIEDVNRESVIEYLKTHQSYYVIVPMVLEDGEKLYRFNILADHERENCYAILVQSADERTRAEIRTRQLLKALAYSYLMVDYIDFEEDRFVRCQTADESAVTAGVYSNEANKYAEEFIHPEDRATMLSFMNIASIREQLMNRKFVSARFRVVKGGESLYREIRYVRAHADAKNAILTVADIDESVKKEEENGRLIQSARERLAAAEQGANRDLLTGVKNITAYTDAISALSEKLARNNRYAFGAVVCDVNGLEKVNATYGHDVGDEYIRSCCKLICDTFKHSPVYRVGGDEFVALLTGSDYANRERLCEEMSVRISLAEKIEDYFEGKASFAFGLAEYEPGVDTSAAAVIKRADTSMYTNKLAMRLET